jgi:ferredoxin
MKMLKIATVLLLLIFVVINVISTSEEAKEIQEFAGKIKIIKGSHYLVCQGEFYELELGTEEYMTEIKLTLENKEKIVLNGFMEDEVIAVHNLTKNDEIYEFIDKSGKVLWEAKKDKPPYIVDAKKCIGCNLCVSSCPTDAIEMIKGIAVIEPAKCISCGICANGNGKNYKGCPVDAISIDE